MTSSGVSSVVTKKLPFLPFQISRRHDFCPRSLSNRRRSVIQKLPESIYFGHDEFEADESYEVFREHPFGVGEQVFPPFLYPEETKGWRVACETGCFGL